MAYGKSPKSDISKEFVKLKKCGYTILNFNSKTRHSSNLAGFVDIVAFNRRTLVFVEVKTEATKDKLSDVQKDTAEKLSSIMAINKTVHYFQIKNLDEAKRLHERILKGL